MLFTRQQIKPRKPKPKYVQPPSVNVSLRQELPTDKYNVQYKPADIKTVCVVLEKVKQHRESWIDSVLSMSMQKSSQVYCDFLENAEEQQYATMDYEKTMAGIFAFDIGPIKSIDLSVEANPANKTSCSSTTPVYDFSQKMEKIKLVTQDFASKTLQQEIDHTMIQFVKKSINSSWLDALESNDSSLDNIDHTFDMKRLQKHYKRMMVWAEQMPKPKQTESLLTLLQSSFRRSMHMVTDSLLSYVTDSPKEGHVYSFSQRLKHMRQFVETSDTEPSMEHEDDFDIRRVFSQRFDEFKMQLPEDEVGQYEEIYEDMIENAFGWKLSARLDLALTEENLASVKEKTRMIIDNYIKTHLNMHLIVIDTFFNAKTAEKELMMRMETYCVQNDIVYLTCTDNGVINSDHHLKGFKIQDIPVVNHFIVLSLHHTSIKISNHLSLLVLWNPIVFLKNYMNHISTYDGYISAYSEKIDNYIKKTFPKKPFYGHLSTSMSTSMFLDIKPLTKYRLFYVGINWHTHSNYKDIRSNSDYLISELIKQNLVNVYGLEKYWGGYGAYNGEIPFDGVSILHKIQDCGVCLALSSKPHIEDEICSMRVFEGISAGVPIICDQNPFFKKWFGNNVYHIDTTTDLKSTVKQIKEYINWMQHNPSEVMYRIEKCREAFQRLSFDVQFKEIFDDVQRQESKMLNNHSICDNS
jgi:hypothetical protein